MFFEDVTKKQVAKYVLLPEVTPRLGALVSSGFANLASFMALVYRAVNLLPDNHPYLKPGAVGTFSIGNVLSEASRNLVFDTKHMDQIIIFFALIAGILILFMQFFLLTVMVFVNPAKAAEMPSNYGEFFTTENRTEDIALRMLDSVFGVEGIFGSKEPVMQPFHQALHGLLQIYSIGLLVIAAMIVIYFIFAILAETAQTGTPFGKRYNHAWAPIRLVAAIGLLIPIGSGLNSAQWITLYAAKFGSGFATTGWIKFHEEMQDETIIPKDQAIATPNIPALKDLVAFIMMAKACKHAYVMEREEIGNKIDAYLIDPNNVKEAIKMPFDDNQARKFSGGGNIHVRFGEKNEVYKDKTSGVYPYCGDLIITNNMPTPKDWVDCSADPSACGDIGSGTSRTASGAEIIAGRYYTLVDNLWKNLGSTTAGAANKMDKAAEEMMKARLSHEPAKDPGEDLKKEVIEAATEHMKEGLEFAIKNMMEEFKKNEDFKKYGWGGAGIWYNKIADMNGKVVNYLYSKPQIKAYPYVMEYTCKKNQQQNKKTAAKECYNPRLAKGKQVHFTSVVNEQIASAMSDVYKYWHKSMDDITGNAFIDTINLLLGTQALFDMCKNADVHPLAQLSSVGKGLVEAAIRNLGYAVGTGVASILPYFGPALGAASSFFSSIASIGILIGFILYYIVPFLPFLYFLFAVGGWVKGIFEAMVGVPLWALAHLRIDGQGLPGEGAINGYFLIFEIFIRPILIIFGMLASILIFAAMVRVLNEIFHLVVSNLSGFDNEAVGNTCGKNAPKVRTDAQTGSIEFFRGPIDEFFFTVVYAILVYMIGMSCFKLIDLIPNKILRWMGAGVATFNDERGEPAEGLVQKIAVGGSIMSSGLDLGKNFKGMAQGTAGGVKDLVGSLSRNRS